MNDRLRRVGGRALIATGVVLVLGALLLPTLERALIDRALQRANRSGLSVASHRILANGRIELRDIAWDHPRASLRCDRIAIDPAWVRTVLRADPHAERIDVGACALDLHDPEPDRSPTAAPSADRPDPLRTAARHLARVTSFSVESVATRGRFLGHPVTVDLRDLVGTGGPNAPSLEAALHTDGLVTVSGRLDASFADTPTLRFRPDGDLKSTLLPGRVRFDEATLLPDRSLSLQRIDAHGQHAGLDVTATLDALRATPPRGGEPLRIDVQGGTLRVARAPAVPGEGTTAESLAIPLPRNVVGIRGEPIVRDGPTVGQRWSARALGASTTLLRLAARARASTWPDLHLGLENVDLAVDDAPAVHIVDARVASGSAEGTVRIAEFGLRFQTDLRKATEIRLNATDVDLARLSPELGADARITGTAELAARIAALPDDAGVETTAELRVRQVTLVKPSVSPLPLGPIDLVLDTTARVTPRDGGAIELNSRGTLNDIPISFAAAIEPRDDGQHLRVTLAVPEPTPCARMWDAVPDGLVPNLGKSAVTFSGSAAPSLSWSMRIADPWSFEMRAAGFPETCRIESMARDWDPERLLKPRFRHHIVEGTLEKDRYCGPGTDDWVPLAEMAPWVPRLMYLSEEIAFHTNGPISLPLMQKGIRLNLETGRYSYGGSTVTQQLVKNLFLSRNKTLSRKFEEAIIAWRMVDVVPRDLTLEYYLNCIEFGPEVFGILQAADYYFGLTPADLTPLEAAYLAQLKPSPRSGGRHRATGHSPDVPAWRDRLRELLSRLVTWGGTITAEEVEYWSPWVVPFPTSPAYAGLGMPRRPRPESFEPSRPTHGSGDGPSGAEGTDGAPLDGAPLDDGDQPR